MTAPPATKKGQLTIQKILKAARKVFAEKGYSDARMSDVVTRARLSTGGLYRYFDNKENLFAALIGDIHEELYAASRGGPYNFATEPHQALLAANRGYLQHYYENRDIMRVFTEAATLNPRFRQIWWDMRTRHVRRFVAALRSVHGTNAGERECELATEAVACMTEHCAYVWFAQERMNAAVPTVEEAAQIVTRAWWDVFNQLTAPRP